MEKQRGRRRRKKGSGFRVQAGNKKATHHYLQRAGNIGRSEIRNSKLDIQPRHSVTNYGTGEPLAKPLQGVCKREVRIQNSGVRIRP